MVGQIANFCITDDCHGNRVREEKKKNSFEKESNTAGKWLRAIQSVSGQRKDSERAVEAQEAEKGQ